ncbi:MAG: sugar ABC transporter permease [Actinobacteria bacterium]|nr:MAG: sugar ABC transporter permease [Actinomycetota bacterium]TML71875.1 MAG: sugar ABC transporter permease [Actinomycetota bacterium]
MTTATETIPAPKRGSFFGARVREAGWGYAFVLLPMAVFGVFFIYPLVYAIYISFFEWGILGKVKGVGTQNYHTLYDDQIFRRAVKNTIEYTVVVVPLEMALGLLMALVINARIRGRAFFRSALYFPSLVSSAAITAIAIYILNADGLLNKIVGGHRSWFGDPSTALWSIVGLNAWTTAGTVMLFYLAALQSIPTDVYEASALDGTGTWRTFWRITFPLLKPAHFFVLVVFGIGALKVFDQAFIVSGGTGGPVYSTYTAVLYIYNEAFKSSNFGVAASAGVVLFVAILLLTVIQRATVGRAEIG